MNCQLLIKHGEKDCYCYKEIKKPKPKKGEVLVRVKACALNNTDIWTKKGLYSKDSEDGWNPNFKLPIIQGADISGYIDSVGDKEYESLIKKKVIVYPVINTNKFNDDIDIITNCKYLGSEVNGGYAEYCLVPFSNIIIVPKYCDLNFYELAAFPTAYMTALHMLNRVNIKDFSSCLVTGASGGVGMALLQLLSIRNIKIFGLSSENKIKELEKNINCKIIDRNNKNLEKIILKENNNQLYDAVFDVVAGENTDMLLNILKNNGSYVCSGAISGRNVNIYWPNFYLKHLNLLGSMLATKQEFLELCFLIFSGKIKPKINKIFELKHLEKAQIFFENKNFIGKIILDCK